MRYDMNRDDLIDDARQRALAILTKRNRLSDDHLALVDAMLSTTVDFLLPTKATPTGFEFGPITIPSGTPTGATIYTQWFLLDNVNNLGFVVSDGRRLTVK